MLLLVGLAAANALYPASEILESERRKAKSFPEVTWDSVMSAEWMRDFETYSLDSFIARESFRSLKAYFLFSVYRQKDNHGIFVVDGNAAKLGEVNQASVAQAADKIQRFTDTYLSGLRVYVSMIPDKSLYIGQNYPLPDYTKAEAILREGMSAYIPLSDVLSAEIFYKTDLHWDAWRLEPVLQRLGQEMGFEVTWDGLYAETLFPFYGGYYGQSALPLQPDTMTLPQGAWMDDVTVKMLDTKAMQMTNSTLYHRDSFSGLDPYDVFLGGAQPLITIENPHAPADKELFLFRDSFGSSIAPLLCGSYGKITLIDLRYINARALPQFVTFTPGTDALFLYSGQILNYAGTLMTE